MLLCHRFILAIILFCSSVPAGAAIKAALFYEDGAPQVQFAADEIRGALGSDVLRIGLDKLSTRGDGLRIVLVSNAIMTGTVADELGLSPLKKTSPQSYAIRVKRVAKQTVVVVLSADPVGAMYGGLDVAEAIRLKTLDQLKDSDHSLYIERRGIKFNIPLDARTPSYSDAGDSAQQNIAEMWSFDFWREFLNDMARDRFNVLSLWNLHPFPSMVKVPEYSDVALDDVRRTTIKLDDTYKTNGTDMVRPEILNNLVTIKRMTIDEKISFWRKVMQYAHDRGVEVYIFTWNIYTFGAEGKYGITSDQANPTTIDYYRKSVRQMFFTYPLLAGIGITAGENMLKGKGADPREQWLWKTYGEGIRDVKKVQPDRDIRLIHRYHQTSLSSIRKSWKKYPGTLDMSYKYSIAHMYSDPAPPFAKQTLAELPSDLRTWMTVRNDDIYSFRWGDPEFARRFVRALPGPDKLAGYYMGPDGYIWGREFISTEPDTPRQLVIDKQWFSFMLWGRLSYDPALPDSLFEKTLAQRFPEASASKLLKASEAASRIIPQVTRFFWHNMDFQWFPEACISRRSYKGFFTVRDFIEGKTMDGSGILSIGDYCKASLAGQPINGITPLQVVDALQSDAKAALALTAELRPVKSKELRLTLGDLDAMAYLGEYYAEKILGATDLALYEKTGKPEQKASAVRHLEQAAAHWKSYASIAASQYRPQLLTRIGYVDLNELTAKVEQDIEIAKK